MPLSEQQRADKKKDINSRLAALRAAEAAQDKQSFIETYKRQVMVNRAIATRDRYAKPEQQAWAKIAEHNKNEADYKGYETFLSGMLAAFYTALRLGVAFTETLKLKIVQIVDATMPILSSPPEYTPNPMVTKVVSAVRIDADRKLKLEDIERTDRKALEIKDTVSEPGAFREAIELWLDERGYTLQNGVIAVQDGRNVPEMTPERFVNLRDHQVDGLEAYLAAHFNEHFELKRAAIRP